MNASLSKCFSIGIATTQAEIFRWVIGGHPPSGKGITEHYLNEPTLPGRVFAVATCFLQLYHSSRFGVEFVKGNSHHGDENYNFYPNRFAIATRLG
jgi:hypothetical protein